MTKKDLTDAVLEALPLGKGKGAISRRQVESVLNGFYAVAANALANGGHVTLKGIGKLRTIPTRARTGHNPKTGAPLQIPAGKRLGVVASKEFKERLKG